MSEPLNLVRNLNEIMEEYVEREEETVQATQAETGQEEERVEAIAEVEQLAEETRKRKIEAIEAETEPRNERVRTFISDKASVLMEKSLKDRGFIVERGFNKAILCRKRIHLSLKCLRREDDNYLVSTRHLAVLYWLKNFMLT